MFRLLSRRFLFSGRASLNPYAPIVIEQSVSLAIRRRVTFRQTFRQGPRRASVRHLLSSSQGPNHMPDGTSKLRITHRPQRHMFQVTDAMCSSVVAQLLFLQSQAPRDPIHVYINSPGSNQILYVYCPGNSSVVAGGSVTAGLAIYDTMQAWCPYL